MNTEDDVKVFVAAIRQMLPNAAAKTDQIMIGRGFELEEEAHYLWIEALADVSNSLIREKNENEFKKHMDYFSVQYDQGSESVKNCIDVSYVENLMWDLKAEDKKWALPLIPDNLMKLYDAMGGQPSF